MNACIRRKSKRLNAKIARAAQRITNGCQLEPKPQEKYSTPDRDSQKNRIISSAFCGKIETIQRSLNGQLQPSQDEQRGEIATSIGDENVPRGERMDFLLNSDCDPEISIESQSQR
jgi:hypothetical protein